MVKKMQPEKVFSEAWLTTVRNVCQVGVFQSLSSDLILLIHAPCIPQSAKLGATVVHTARAENFESRQLSLPGTVFATAAKTAIVI